MALPSEPPVMLVSRSVMQDAHKGEPPRRLTDSVYDHEHDALGLFVGGAGREGAF